MIDVIYKLSGQRVPKDCAYNLFAALCHYWPELHDRTDIGILPLMGQYNAPNRDMQPEGMTLRVQEADLKNALMLAGKSLRIDDKMIQIEAVERVAELESHATLYSYLVTVKERVTAPDLLAYVQEDLDRRGIGGTAALVPRVKATLDKDPFIRRTVNLKTANVVGYAVKVSGLSPEDSIRLQVEGVGGRRHFGCGIFYPKQEAGRPQAEPAKDLIITRHAAEKFAERYNRSLTWQQAAAEVAALLPHCRKVKPAEQPHTWHMRHSRRRPPVNARLVVFENDSVVQVVTVLPPWERDSDG